MRWLWDALSLVNFSTIPVTSTPVEAPPCDLPVTTAADGTCLSKWLRKDWGNEGEILHCVTQRAISGFSLSSKYLFCMALQKEISEKTLNKWDKHLSLVHTLILMPILSKYPMEENKGGWYHGRQSKASGYTLCLMQTLLCLAFDKLLHCTTCSRQHIALFLPLAQDSPLSPGDVMRAFLVALYGYCAALALALFHIFLMQTSSGSSWLGPLCMHIHFAQLHYAQCCVLALKNPSVYFLARKRCTGCRRLTHVHQRC